MHADTLVATVHVGVPEEISGIIDESLAPEVERPTSERSRVIISPKKGGVVILIEASDSVVLRAAINSYLHWVGTILDVVEAVG